MDKITINGFYDKIITYKPMADTFFSITTDECKEYVTKYNNIVCSGNVPILKRNHPISLTGYWSKNKNGYVFNVEEYDDHIEVISGVYNRTFFRNEENGYTIFSLSVEKNTPHRSEYGSISCAGNMSVYGRDIPLLLYGYWEETKTGFLFRIDKTEFTIDKEEIAINYLSTDLCKGIGKKTAEEIIKYTGPNIFDFITKPNAVDLLVKNVKYLNKEKAEKLISSINDKKKKKNVFDYIVKFGGSSPAAIQIVNRYGQFALQRLKSNPYEVGEVGSLSFYICDAIAKECGISAYSDIRIDALINEAFNLITQNGDTFTTQQKLYDTINFIVKNSFFNVKISKFMIMPRLNSSKFIVIEYDNGDDKHFRIFPKYLYQHEQSIVASIKRLNTNIELDFDESLVDEVEILYDMQYDASQKETFKLLKTSGIKILTGGPGTGKTTTIDGLIKVYNLMYPDKKIVLCAPTGRAAQKMKESTAHEALTIHKILDYQPYGNEAIYKNALNPINADFIIIDEFSMVDTTLMSILLNAIKPGTLILFVGDIDQLPSVGPGNVMRDLLKSERIETYHLKKVFRQNKDSNIIINANRINKGNNNLNTGKDFEIYNFKEKTELLDFLSNLLKEYKNTNLNEFQILSPIKNSIIGVDDINILAQKEFNDKKVKINVIEQMLTITHMPDVENINYRYYKGCDEAPDFNIYNEPFFIDYGNWIFEYFYEIDGEKSRIFKDVIKVQPLEISKNTKPLTKINYGKFEFRRFDKIIMTRNNYEERYYNGDIGEITDIHEKYLEVLINGEYKTVKRSNWNDIELAYAITIHKSQGSEYDTVIVVVPNDIQQMLQRNLIFTAVTRAKKKVIILNELDGLNYAIKNDKTNVRNTFLYERLIDKKTKILPQLKDVKFSLL